MLQSFPGAKKVRMGISDGKAFCSKNIHHWWW